MNIIDKVILNLQKIIKINKHININILFDFCADIQQETTPREVPVTGDPFSDISLDLIFPKGKPIFILNGKKLQLLQPLDRDKENLSHIVLQVSDSLFIN